MKISFTVTGQPVPKARPRVTGRATFMPARYVAYRSTVTEAAMVAAGINGWNAHAQHYAVRVSYWLENARRVDVDNLLGATFDALNKVLFADDSMVVEVRARKGIDRACPRAEVEVEALDGAPHRRPVSPSSEDIFDEVFGP